MRFGIHVLKLGRISPNILPTLLHFHTHERHRLLSLLLYCFLLNFLTLELFQSRKFLIQLKCFSLKQVQYFESKLR
jgi:hypothetical protein